MEQQNQTLQPVQVTPKPYYKSTTFWLNVATVAAVALKIGVDSGSITDPDVLAILVALVNIVNRFRTSVPVVPSL